MGGLKKEPARSERSVPGLHCLPWLEENLAPELPESRYLLERYLPKITIGRVDVADVGRDIVEVHMVEGIEKFKAKLKNESFT